jgi:endonuclease-8
MPEGPEIRRAADCLAAVLVDAGPTRVELRPAALRRWSRTLSGREVRSVVPRGKALLTTFDGGLALYSHNQLYGEWDVLAPAAATDARRQVRVVIATAVARAVLYSATDIAILDAAAIATHPYLAKLGPDVLDPATTAPQIASRLDAPRFRGRSLAALLLDQSFAAGLGNYLRSEILHLAGLRADRRPRDLDPATRRRLARLVVDVPRRSYRTAGVVTSAAVARAERQRGAAFEDWRFHVFDRAGRPCRACGTPIERVDIGGRGVFFCPGCQPS